MAGPKLVPLPSVMAVCVAMFSATQEFQNAMVISVFHVISIMISVENHSFWYYHLIKGGTGNQ